MDKAQINKIGLTEAGNLRTRMLQINWIRSVAALFFQVLAVVVLLELLAGLSIGIWTQYEANREAYRIYQRHVASDEKGVAAIIAKKCSASLKESAVAKCLADEVFAFRAVDSTNRDLQAQQSMAYWSFWTFVVTAIGVPIAIAGVAAVLFALRQTRQAISTDREVGHAQVRAYIGFEIAKPPAFGPGDKPAASFKLINTGQSPANKIRHLTMIEILDHPLPKNQGSLVEPAPGQSIPRVTIRAGGEITIDAEADHPITRDEIDELVRGGNRRLYLVSKVIYEDVFKSIHTSELCAFLELETVTMAANGNRVLKAQWALSDVANDAT